MIEGSCHCGAVQWRIKNLPESATACNCTVCRRYGALWAYDYLDEGISVTGSTQDYMRGDSIEFHFCSSCGCVAYWKSQNVDANGRCRIAVNLRLADPGAVGNIPIEHFDGFDSFDDLGRDGKSVSDYWF